MYLDPRTKGPQARLDSQILWAGLRRSACAIGLSLALTAGCAVAALAAGDTPVTGGTVVPGVDGSTITNLNTQLTSITGSLVIADVWADGLMTYDGKGNRIPRLAESWSVSDDNLTYTFKIKSGVKWSDGEPFTAADVAFTLEAFGSLNTYIAKSMPLIESVSAPDDTTFVVKLKKPLTAILDLFDKEVFPLMPKHIYEGTDVTSNEANRAPVGLGPFRFVNWDTGRAITFERNPHYWEEGKPYIDSVVFALIPDAQQQLNALTRGEIDWVKLNATQVPAAEEASKNGAFKVIEIINNAPERAVVDFNMRKAPFDNQKVRAALFMAIDRDRVVKDAYQGLANKAVNAIPVQFKALHDGSIDYNKLYPYDPVAAGKLLDEAGFPMKDGKRFSAEVTYIAKPPYDAISRVIAAMWKEVGVDATLSGLDAQIWIDKVYKQHEFDASVISLTGRTNPVLGIDRSYRCTEGGVPFVNPTGYCDPELDKLIDAAAAAPEGQQQAPYAAYAAKVAEDINEITLTNVRLFEAASTRLMGLEKQFDFSYNTHPNWQEVWIPKDKQK
ncbi:ABC transporter substrate-binding protein [Seohaeicola zhoushanensis]|uniref:Peptide ABC transporter substrate-binding protein n=1 Tax=Seohaeicola zhoushanensis TaxID=1569283 RepID=A0A8J3H2E1_9RHOB|nr:ABC transporter substrate-binding protein [Seohaeicola zhoushanensis]GHF70763.1 peptide ABC transporter substrate-binding protein [Seohaeicola zhoushanensis]